MFAFIAIHALLLSFLRCIATVTYHYYVKQQFKYKIALNFSSSEATQTVTLSDCIGFVPVAFTVNAQRYAQLVNHYFSDLSFDSQTGLLTVTRANASAYATAQLGIFFMRQPS